MKIFKKILCTFLVVIMCLTAAPLDGFIDVEWSDLFSFEANATMSLRELEPTDQCGDNVYWNYDKSTEELVISGNGDMYNSSFHLGFESESKDYPLSNSSIKSVVIEDGVKSIGEYAFANCWNLEKVIIPDSITSIGLYSFAGCVKLKEIVIPNSVTRIYGSAFDGCKSLESIVIPDSVLSIDSGAFENCTNLKEITISKNAQIDDAVFNNTAYYNDVNNWEKGVLYIGTHLIEAKDNISGKYLIKEGTTSIAFGAFFECTKLTGVTIPDSVTHIGSNAFSSCENLVDISISDNIKEIDSFAFSYTGYSNDESNWEDDLLYLDKYLIQISESFSGDCIVKNGTSVIANSALSDGYITNIFIPDSVRNIGGIINNYGLENIFVSENNQFYSSDAKGVLFNKDKSILIQYPDNNESEMYVVPDSVLKIGNYAFYDCANLMEIELPANLSIIGTEAFSFCYNLESIYLPHTLTTIGDGAFRYCEQLTSIAIGDNVKIIGGNAFECCENLETVELGNNLSKIGCEAFAQCDSLQNIRIPSSVEYIGLNPFMWCYNLENISVDTNNNYYLTDSYGVLYNKDKTNLIQYPVASQWTSYTIANTVKNIGNHTFNNAVNLINVKLPNALETIGYYAFCNCSNLKNIIIPDKALSICHSAFYNTAYYNNSDNWEDGVLYIGKHLIEAKSSIFGNYHIKNDTLTIAAYAFDNCENLINITLPTSLINIGEYAFRWCSNLTDVTIPDSVKSIGGYAFNECIKLASISIPDSVEDVGNWAFYGCKKLTNATLGNTISKIGYGVFAECNSLSSVTFGNRVEIILDYAFVNCNNLTDIYFNATEEEWNNIIIGSYNDPLLNANIHFLGTPHAHTLETITIPATCTVPGMEYQICTAPECNGAIIGEAKVLPASGHKPETITISSTCTVEGMQYDICTNAGCGSILGEAKVLEKAPHTPGEWEIIAEATYEADGKRIQKCTICGTTIKEEVIPKLVKVTVTDEETGVTLEFDSTKYDGEVKVNVSEIFDGNSFNLVSATTGGTKTAIFDITMSVDGIATQPNGKITVKIPVPAGFNPNLCFVHYLNTDNGTVEQLPTDHVNGYIIFETDHFSYYAVVEMPDIDNCCCKCHSTNFIIRLIWKITLFFNRILRRNKECACGIYHY